MGNRCSITLGVNSVIVTLLLGSPFTVFAGCFVALPLSEPEGPG